MIRRTSFAALAAVTIALTLSACSTAAAEPESTPTSKPTKTTTPSPEPTPTSTPTPEPEETAGAAPTCETIIAPSTIAALTEHGWTYREHEFRFGDHVVDGGIQCVWGDYTVPSDHVQVFGWAPVDQAASSAGQQKLLDDGWQRADSDGHVYITENPETAMSPDQDGFGMTYEFGDGWVKVADTRRGLVLVEFD
ncbi:hypothetical protein [Microbacterium murale]|uniref:Uncharacterized protein n=1 Tax=Microbacterium murale TaxID=1081040 RepID=A0ABQ1RSM1_9MICO|nr:hypothetical protein [Microbacterium murale]GGD80135.1 hypothetical protein GCM10007269_23800 [Microbacterium murale]